MSGGREEIAPVKVGLVLPMFSGDAERVLAFARTAEELGYDGVFAFDHFFPPGGSPAGPSLEAFATLAAVASATERVAVGTLVARATLRSAGMLAKLAAGLDHVSHGRTILGIGTGDPIDEPEHRVFGIPYLDRDERRVHLVELVRAVRALFLGQRWEGGRYVPSMAGPLLPRPTTPGGPPIWIGGFADAVVRIAAREADAWNGWGMASAEFARKVRLLRAEAADAGREVHATWAGIAVVGRDDVEVAELLRARADRGLEPDVWAGTATALAAHLRELAAAGATWVVLVPAGGAGRVELIAREVLARRAPA